MLHTTTTSRESDGLPGPDHLLAPFRDVGLTRASLALAIGEHTGRVLPRLDKLWTYYRNPLRPVGAGETAWCGDGGDLPGSGLGVRRRGGWYRQAQEIGLPNRLTGAYPSDAAVDDRIVTRREVVIENDIAWRVQTMVDFLLAKPVSVVSTARDEKTRTLAELALDAMWEASGGIALLQDMALLGHVYGHVDLLLRVDAGALAAARGGSEEEIVRAARAALRVELLSPTRSLAVLDPSDYRRTLASVIHFERRAEEGTGRESDVDEPSSWLARTFLGRRRPADFGRGTSTVTEIISASHRQLYEDGRLVDEEALGWTGGDLPVAHIQNISQPFRYEGMSEVEPLIPLQDELNTRLSDRASRVTMQAFKMYLARGVDGFDKVPVAPGQIWSTDNLQASVQAFGGDADTPSEESHIAQVRDAMDKVSGVPPLSSGVVQAKVGSLSSANAIRITLMSLLSKTARKRVAYGRGMASVSSLALGALDAFGILRTARADRGVRLVWPDPLPQDPAQEVVAAKGKVELGVPQRRVLAELGYSTSDQGIQ